MKRDDIDGNKLNLDVFPSKWLDMWRPAKGFAGLFPANGSDKKMLLNLKHTGKRAIIASLEFPLLCFFTNKCLQPIIIHHLLLPPPQIHFTGNIHFSQ